MTIFSLVGDALASFVAPYYYPEGKIINEKIIECNIPSLLNVGNSTKHFCSLTEGKLKDKDYYAIKFCLKVNKTYTLLFSNEWGDEVKIKALETSCGNTSFITKTFVGEIAEKIKNHILVNKELWTISEPKAPKEPEKPHPFAYTSERCGRSRITKLDYFPEIEGSFYGRHKIHVVYPTPSELEKYELKLSKYPKKLLDYSEDMKSYNVKNMSRIEKCNELALMAKNLFETVNKNKG